MTLNKEALKAAIETAADRRPMRSWAEHIKTAIQAFIDHPDCGFVPSDTAGRGHWLYQRLQEISAGHKETTKQRDEARAEAARYRKAAGEWAAQVAALQAGEPAPDDG
ncbi:MAG: hypothetical protein IH904_00205 [Proteobacteria bacterium]|nr:hypothetical protein [Pseudomonadota bacterium]